MQFLGMSKTFQSSKQGPAINSRISPNQLE